MLIETADSLESPAAHHLSDDDFDLTLDLGSGTQAVPPFAIPDNLTPLSADDAALFLADAQGPHPLVRVLQVLALLILLAALGGQLIWLQRSQLAEIPAFAPLCARIDCPRPQPTPQQAFDVVERHIGPAPDAPDALTLEVSFRNASGAALPLPDLRLSLFDNAEKVLARRRLKPWEYLFPAPADNARAAPQEVFTIKLSFSDPGAHATGFRLDFL